MIRPSNVDLNRLAMQPTTLTPAGRSAAIIAAGGDPSVPSLAYVTALPEWKLIRDILGGARVIRSRKTLYLPKYTNEPQPDYDMRVRYAPFVNHFRDNLNTIVSKPFSKEVVLQGNVSPDLREIAEDIDGHGTGQHKFARDIFKEGVAFGVVGLYVDFPNMKGAETLADERRLGPRPYWCMYKTEDILALFTEMRSGRKYVTHVRLAENIIRRVGFSEQLVRRVRILDDDGQNRTWALYEETGAGWVAVGQGELTLPEIPFRLFKPGDREWITNATVSPLVDLAHLQIEHYQQSSNLKHVLNLTGFPMLAGNGVSPPMDKEGKPIRLRIGPNVVCFAPPQMGTSGYPEWKFIEPTGNSMERLQVQIEHIEDQMSKLGMAPLVRNSGGVTATAYAVNAAKAHAAAEAWASDLKDVLEECWEFTALWMGKPAGSGAEVYIHTDFGIDLRESKENAELLDAEKEEVISTETLWDEWQRRGFLGPQFNPDVEKKRLEAQRAADIKRQQQMMKLGLMANPNAAPGGAGKQNGPAAGKKKGKSSGSGEAVMYAQDEGQEMTDTEAAA
jgi:hypothetical protein